MLRRSSLIKMITLEVMMFGSLALTAQAIESPMKNSPSSVNSPILVSQSFNQSYGGGNSSDFEADGDRAFREGEDALENGDYERAYHYFDEAAYFYEQCYREMERDNDPNIEIVARKLDEAEYLMEQAY